MTTRITVNLPAKTAGAVNDMLDYGDSRSEWIRSAIDYRLEHGFDDAYRDDIRAADRTERISFSLPDDIAEAIDDRLEYGDSRSEWIRGAIRQYLHEQHEGNLITAR